MNRLIIIGNGFDLAHDLPTSYREFIQWYWDDLMHKIINDIQLIHWRNNLVEFKIIKDNGFRDIDIMTQTETSSYFNRYDIDFFEEHKKYAYADIDEDINHFKDMDIEFSPSPLFENIIKGIETKGWVDIEIEYYKLLKEYALNKEETSIDKVKSLNEQFLYLKIMLMVYFKQANQLKIDPFPSIETAIYAPIKIDDIDRNQFKKISDFEVSPHNKESSLHPNKIMLLNFNYTNTAKKYVTDDLTKKHNIAKENIPIVHIHGNIVDDDEKGIIFGYGDELDDNSIELEKINNNEIMKNMKSINYLQNSHYRTLINFINSAPFQVLIFGHSCGLSDKTLLNTIFEHDNCVSIKPYYYQKSRDEDNYEDIAINIYRNFSDKKKYRARVVEKKNCSPLVPLEEEKE